MSDSDSDRRTTPRRALSWLDRRLAAVGLAAGVIGAASVPAASYWGQGSEQVVLVSTTELGAPGVVASENGVGIDVKISAAPQGEPPDEYRLYASDRNEPLCTLAGPGVCVDNGVPPGTMLWYDATAVRGDGWEATTKAQVIRAPEAPRVEPTDDPDTVRVSAVGGGTWYTVDVYLGKAWKPYVSYRVPAGQTIVTDVQLPDTIPLDSLPDGAVPGDETDMTMIHAEAGLLEVMSGRTTLDRSGGTTSNTAPAEPTIVTRTTGGDDVEAERPVATATSPRSNRPAAPGGTPSPVNTGAVPGNTGATRPPAAGPGPTQTSAGPGAPPPVTPTRTPPPATTTTPDAPPQSTPATPPEDPVTVTSTDDGPGEGPGVGG